MQKSLPKVGDYILSRVVTAQGPMWGVVIHVSPKLIKWTATNGTTYNTPVSEFHSRYVVEDPPRGAKWDPPRSLGRRY